MIDGFYLLLTAALSGWPVIAGGTFRLLTLFHFYSHFDGGILRDFLRRTIHYFIYVGVCLFGISYELAKSEAICWPLIGGYLAVMGAAVYGIRRRSQRDAEEESEVD